MEYNKKSSNSKLIGDINKIHIEGNWETLALRANFY